MGEIWNSGKREFSARERSVLTKRGKGVRISRGRPPADHDEPINREVNGLGRTAAVMADLAAGGAMMNGENREAGTEAWRESGTQERGEYSFGRVAGEGLRRNNCEVAELGTAGRRH